MYQLKEIRILNFKSIDYVIVKFSKNKTVFVGKNNAGKSNILKAIALFFSGNHKEITVENFNDRSKDIVLEADILQNNNSIITLKIIAKIVDNKVVVKYEENYDAKQRKNISEFLKKINFIYIPGDRNSYNRNNSWYTKILDLILENKKESIESQDIFRNLENILKSVKSVLPKEKNTKFSTSLSHLNETNFSILKNDDNEIMRNLDEIIKKEENKSDIRNFDDLTIGTKNFVLMALFDLYLKSIRGVTKSDTFKIFIIEEPENFLHPHSIRLIDKLLQDIAEVENTQIIYSTHANELVSNFKKDKFEIDSLRFVYKMSGFTKVKQIENKYGDYDKIMINLMFKNTDVFFSDAVILVEGETEKISIPNIYEYWPWNEQDLKDCSLEKCSKYLGQNKVNDFFNLDLKNIAVIDVGGKGALADWYEFCSELLGKKNVFAIIDRDANFYEDKRNIERAIKRVYKVHAREERYIDFNWIILDGEFENYYKAEKIKEYLGTVLKERYKDDYLTKKEINHLIYKLDHLKITKKISVSYEKLFKTYLRGYGKPTIAFNLCIWLCENNGYKKGLIDILKNILYKVEKNRNIGGNEEVVHHSYFK
nr:AAA family ATPase [Candidatus Gracilibacteria bacterium]